MSFTIEEMTEGNRKQIMCYDQFGIAVSSTLMDNEGFVRSFALSNQVQLFGENRDQKVLAVFKLKKSKNAKDWTEINTKWNKIVFKP